jgi:hypothetical protein
LVVSLFVLFPLFAGAALADDRGPPRRFAVLSLIGDTMNVVTYQPAVAGNTDRNRREAHPIPGGVFDRTALLAADAALRQQDPHAAVILLAGAPALYAEADRLADGSRLARRPISTRRSARRPRTCCSSASTGPMRGCRPRERCWAAASSRASALHDREKR